MMCCLHMSKKISSSDLKKKQLTNKFIFLKYKIVPSQEFILFILFFVSMARELM